MRRAMRGDSILVASLRAGEPLPGGCLCLAGDCRTISRISGLQGRQNPPAQTQAPSTSTTPPYGWGLSLVALDERVPRVGHHGAMTGFTGMLTRYADGIVIGVLTNRGGIWADGLEAGIARVVLGHTAPLDVEGVEQDLAADLMRAYAGTYDAGSFRIEIVGRDRHLWLQVPSPGPATVLRLVGDGRFVGEGPHAPIRVEFDCAARGCARLRLRMAGMWWFGER